MNFADTVGSMKASVLEKMSMWFGVLLSVELYVATNHGSLCTIDRGTPGRRWDVSGFSMVHQQLTSMPATPDI
jgi:hypothetical protein